MKGMPRKGAPGSANGECRAQIVDQFAQSSSSPWQQRKLRQVTGAGQPSVSLDQFGCGNRDQPFVHDFLGMQLAVTAEAKAHGGMKVRAREIHRLGEVCRRRSMSGCCAWSGRTSRGISHCCRKEVRVVTLIVPVMPLLCSACRAASELIQSAPDPRAEDRTALGSQFAHCGRCAGTAGVCR